MRLEPDRLHLAAYGCALYLLVSVGRVQEMIPQLSVLAIGKVAILIAFLGIMLDRDSYGIRVFGTPLGKRIVAFALIAAISIVFSIWVSHSIIYLINDFLSVIILFYLVDKTATTMKVFRYYVNSLILSAGVLSYFTVQLNWGGRLSVGNTYDANDLASVLVTILPLALVSFIQSGTKGKVLYGLSIGLSLVAILLTESRGGFIGLAVVGIYILLAKIPTTHDTMRKRFTIPKLTALVLACGLVVTAGQDEMWTRMETILHPEEDYNLSASGGRIAIWKRGLDTMFERPFGVGIANFEAAEGRFGRGTYQAPHNTLIQVGVELGVAGLFIFLAFYRSSLRLLTSANKRALQFKGRILDSVTDAMRVELYVVGFRGCLLGFLVTSFFLSIGYSSLFYALLALIDALHRLLPQRRDA